MKKLLTIIFLFVAVLTYGQRSTSRVYALDLETDLNNSYSLLLDSPDFTSGLKRIDLLGLKNFLFNGFSAFETDPIFLAWNKSSGISITESQISDFGNYLTSFTETDPIFSSSLSNIVLKNQANTLAERLSLSKDLAINGYILEKHASEESLIFNGNIIATGEILAYGNTGTSIGSIFDNIPIATNTSLGTAMFNSTYFDVSSTGDVTIKADAVVAAETDPVFSAWNKSSGITITESQISDLGNYLTSFSETDPIYSAWNKSTGISITESQISDFGKYLTSFTETDPIYSAWNKSTGISITESQISDFGKYLTSFTETDPIFSASLSNIVLKNQANTLAERLSLSKDLAINGYILEKHASEESLIFNGNIIATGEILAYGNTGTNIESIFDNIPIATNTSLGTAMFNSTYFDVSLTGDVTIKADAVVADETDPVFSAWNRSSGITITEGQISDLGSYANLSGNTAYDFNVKRLILSNQEELTTAGYLTYDYNNASTTTALGTYSSTNPVGLYISDGIYSASVWTNQNFTDTHIANWQTAYSWGDWATSVDSNSTSIANLLSGSTSAYNSLRLGGTLASSYALKSYVDSEISGIDLSNYARTDIDETFLGSVNFSSIHFNPNGANIEIDADASDRVIFSFNKESVRKWSLRSQSDNLNFNRDSGSGEIQIDGNTIYHEGNLTSNTDFFRDRGGLTSSDDLDLIVDNGNYGWSSSVPLNTPILGTGSNYKNLFVRNDGGQPTQMIWGGSEYGKIAIRRRDSGTWLDWSEFYSDKNSNLSTVDWNAAKGTFTLATSGSQTGVLIEQTASASSDKLLHIKNDYNIGSASYMIYTTTDTPGEEFWVSGTGVVSAPVLDVNNLSQGYIPYDNGTNLVDSPLWASTTKIGVRTATPDQNLSVEDFMSFQNSGTNRITLGYNSATGYGEYYGLSTLNGLKFGFADAINTFVLDNSGKVGFGTSAPSGTIHISSTDTDQLFIERTGSISGKYRLGIAGLSNRFYFTNMSTGVASLILDENDDVNVENDLTVKGNISSANGDTKIGDDGIYFENDKHAITFNDGFGNFNIRVGNNGISNEYCTEAGYIFQDEYTQSTGTRLFNVSSGSLAVGAAPSWRSQITYTPNYVKLAYQGNTKLTTESGGVAISGYLTTASTDTYESILTSGGIGFNTYAVSTDNAVVLGTSISGTAYIRPAGKSSTAQSTFTASQATIGTNTAISGNLTATGEVTAYSASDRRLKTKIRPIENATSTLSKLRPVTFIWNDKAKKLNKSKDNRNNFGLIAQELEQTLPELVHPLYENYKSVDYEQLIALLIKSNQELNERLMKLESEILIHKNNKQ